jgi:putative flippase GtrA
LFRTLEIAQPIPFVGTIARIGLKLQALAWRWRPELTEKLSNFLPIGGSCVFVQFVIMFWCKQWGVEENRANILSTEIAVFMSFQLNRAITWRERIPPRRKPWSIPIHFVIYNVLLPMPWIMVLGFGGLSALGWPWWLSWCITQLVVVAVNFIVSDRLSFGRVVRMLY